MQFEIVREGRCRTCFIPLSDEELENNETQCSNCKKVDWVSKIKDRCFICGAELGDMRLERYLQYGNCCQYCSRVSSNVAMYKTDTETADKLTVERINKLSNMINWEMTRDNRKMAKVWGIIVEERINDGNIMWILNMEKPFSKITGGGLWIGINEKVIREAQSRGVRTFRIDYEKNKDNELLLLSGVIKDGTYMGVPSKKEIAEMDKRIEDYTDIPSKFPGAPDMRVYYFIA